MDQHEIKEKLQRVTVEVERLGHDLCAMERTDVSLYPNNFAELASTAALRGEQVTCALRQLACMQPRQKAQYLPKAVKTHHISVHETDQRLCITLPCLLPKRRMSTRSEFLLEPLFYCLQEYALHHPIQMHAHSTVCFYHIYDEALHPQFRDYDNMECKQVLDAVALFFLPDDSGSYCDVYHTSQIGPCDQTKIYVLPANDFPNWLLQVQKLG